MLRRSCVPLNRAAGSSAKTRTGRSNRAISSPAVKVSLAKAPTPKQQSPEARTTTAAAASKPEATPSPPAARPRRSSSRKGANAPRPCRVVKTVKLVRLCSPRSFAPLEGGLAAFKRDHGEHLTILTPDDIWGAAGITTTAARHANVLHNVADAFAEDPTPL